VDNAPATPGGIGQLAEDLLDAWNAHDTGRITKFYAPDYAGVDVGEAEPQRGPQAISRSVDRYLRAFPTCVS
jgi:ketosteroid isomerase-like protein